MSHRQPDASTGSSGPKSSTESQRQPPDEPAVATADPTAEQARLLELKAELERERAKLARERKRRAERSTPEYKERQRVRRLRQSAERERERETIRAAEREFIQKKLGLGKNNKDNQGRAVVAGEGGGEGGGEGEDLFGTWENWGVPGGVPRLIETPPTPPPGKRRKVVVHCEGDGGLDGRGGGLDGRGGVPVIVMVTPVGG
ncbi:hypothetical protein EDC01DRAFT_779392 [Geopyxis carbonaria]|nr:hypothetical protein EDC01DRAFT_779392 [Geopyxis carbonaria]